MTELGSLGGPTSCAYAINNRGQVVGSAEIATGSDRRRAFLWQKGVISDLQAGGFIAWATAINARGQVVGVADFLTLHAFSWSHGDSTRLPHPGTSYAHWASGINTQGLVVGGCFDWANPPQIPSHDAAVVWEQGESVLLPTLGGRNSGAAAINSRGEIAGYSMTTAGETHAVVWR